jgi:hypothetical protein
MIGTNEQHNSVNHLLQVSQELRAALNRDKGQLVQPGGQAMKR